jgi:hypothetical protein
MQTKIVRIMNDLLAAPLIEQVNLSAMINGSEPGIEVKLKTTEDTFQYVGDHADAAYDVLTSLIPDYLIKVGDLLVPSESVVVGGKLLVFGSIECANLSADFNGTQGVEVRVSTDGFDVNNKEVTRRYIGQTASQVYDLLIQLHPEEQEATVINVSQSV